MSEDQVIHEVDGIREEDNKLPRWWLATFFGAILFSVGYWEYYHTFHVGELPREELASDLRRIRAPKGGEEKALTNEALLATVSTDSASGQQLFAANCASCHGDKGEGKIGPNLTDGYWLHGGAPVDIHRSISEGWPLKGMPAWKPVLGTDKVGQIAAYVLSIRGRNIPGKAPEGEQQASAPAAASPSAVAANDSE